jgi:glucose-6-phosphate 1-dehydrogenase
LYKRHSWGPKQADSIIAADGGWHNPGSADSSA